MLTRHSRSLSTVRAFILAPSSCTARTSHSTSHSTAFISPWNIHASRCTRKRYYSNTPSHSQGVHPNDDKAPSSMPYALRAAAQAFEEQLHCRELDFLAESYIHFREVLLKSHCRRMMPSDDHALPRLLQFPEEVLKDAMTLLVTSSLREHADLHLMMFNDLASVFHTFVTLDPPLEFTAKAFQEHLDSKAMDKLPHIYDHLCHICDAVPLKTESYVSNAKAWPLVLMWMKHLANAPNKEHTKLLCRLIYDLPRFFHTRPTTMHHHCVIKGFLGIDMLEEAWNWLQQMEQNAHSPALKTEKVSWWTKLRSFTWSGDPTSRDDAKPTSINIWTKPLSEEYDIFLGYFARRGDFVSAQSLMTHMFASGLDAAPTRRSWHMLLSAVLVDPKTSVARIETVVEELERAGHAVHLRTLRLISGRGPLKTWVTKEKFDVIEAAAARFNVQQSAGPDTATQTGYEDMNVASDCHNTNSTRAARGGSVQEKIPSEIPHSEPSDPDASKLTVQPPIKPAFVNDTLVERTDTVLVDPTSSDSMDGEELGLVRIPLEETNVNPGDVGIHMHTGILKEAYLDGKFPDLQSREPLIVVPEVSAVSNVQQVMDDNPDNANLRRIRRNVLSAAQRGDLRDATKYYAELSKLARTDLEVADALIRALCWGKLRAPPRRQILQAIQVFKDLVQPERQNANGVKGFFHGRTPRIIEQQKTYSRIYNILLRALSAPLSMKASSRDTSLEVQEQYIAFSMELLADMEAQGLRPDNRTVSSILLLRFRGARDHVEAFEYYRSLVTGLEIAARASTNLYHDSKPQGGYLSGTMPLLDLAGYRAVLNAFGKLSFPTAPIAPAELWLSIVKDMRARGHVVTVEDYTIFLGGILAQKPSPFALQRAALGIPSPEGEEARMRAMHASVKHLHEAITVDPNIAPDATLMNTLMNAYQLLGRFRDTLKVFNAIWVSGRMDDVTPVIIFDACGHARSQHEASMIWCMFIERGWKFDKRSLDTWVECLCRLGDVEAACKFVCVYMGRDNAGYLSKGDTRPDVQTCLILLKLSWAVGQNLDVKERIRSHLPHLWNKLAAHYT